MKCPNCGNDVEKKTKWPAGYLNGERAFCSEELERFYELENDDPDKQAARAILRRRREEWRGIWEEANKDE